MQSAIGAAKPDRAGAGQILDVARSEGRQFVMEPEAKEILRRYGIATPRGRLCIDLKESLSAADELGYPVAVKIVSPRIVHKTEMGGVRVNVASAQGLREAHAAIMEAAGGNVPAGEIRGVLVEEMASGYELIIGASRDAQFGPIVMFGLGGIFVEVLKDVSYRLAPVDALEAREMIGELKGYPMLSGARGRRPVDEEALAEVLVRVSRLITDFPEIREMDLNPTFVDGSRVGVADARIVID